jgi:Eukaryotic aspartyl protease
MLFLIARFRLLSALLDPLPHPAWTKFIKMFRETSFSALLLLFISSANAAAVPAWKRGTQYTSSVSKAQAFQAPSPLEKTSNFVSIQKSEIPSKHLALLQGLQKIDGIEGTFTVDATAPSTTLISGLGGQEYLVPIEWAGTSVNAILDTGSSDTWLIQSGFQCVDANGNSVAESTCNFGPPFNGNFNEGSIKNENFNISYGDGEYVNGNLGYEDVTVAGITVKKQEVSLLQNAI